MELYKLGKLPPKRDPRTLKLWDYLGDTLPVPPPSVDYSTAVPEFPMYLNDRLGDCAIACPAHMVQVWTCDVGDHPTTPSDAEVLTEYEIVGGYKGTPETDQGCVALDVLNQWRKVGLFGHQIYAFTKVNPTNHTEVMDGINLFGALYIGVALPLSAQGKDEWLVVDSPQSEPGSWGGHAVPIVAYNPDYLTVVTWGGLLNMSWNFLDAYCDEAYAALSLDWIARSGQAPSGLDLSQLQDDLARL